VIVSAPPVVPTFPAAAVVPIKVFPASAVTSLNPAGHVPERIRVICPGGNAGASDLNREGGRWHLTAGLYGAAERGANVYQISRAHGRDVYKVLTRHGRMRDGGR